jgi:hypothetical protein
MAVKVQTFVFKYCLLLTGGQALWRFNKHNISAKVRQYTATHFSTAIKQINYTQTLQWQIKSFARLMLALIRCRRLHGLIASKVM